MRQIHKYALLLVLINILICGAAFLIISFSGSNIHFTDIIILSSLFSVISVITLVIFLRGNNREPDSQAMHTLVSVSLKFLLDMVLALVWFFISKKNSLSSVFVFFVIYLTLTLFTLFVVLKVLKLRSL